MKNTDLGSRIKSLRIQNGLSQELLAENVGLSLRTIQRIESGQSAPRGETLKRLVKELNVSLEEITQENNCQEDQVFLRHLNLSSLSFLFFPILGVLIPFSMWISRKGKIQKIRHLGKELINFQITWIILLFLVFLFFIGSSFYQVHNATYISPSLIISPIYLYLTIGILYLYNLVLVLINTYKIKNNQSVNYPMKINFIR